MTEDLHHLYTAVLAVLSKATEMIFDIQVHEVVCGHNFDTSSTEAFFQKQYIMLPPSTRMEMCFGINFCGTKPMLLEVEQKHGSILLNYAPYLLNLR